MQAEATASQTDETYQACPSCSRRIPAHVHYRSWCECGWNLEPSDQDASQGRIEATYLKLGQRMGKKLLQDMIQDSDAQEKLFRDRLLTNLFAGLVHAVTAALFIGCWYLIVKCIQGITSFICSLRWWRLDPGPSV
ncbi:hypothetical protein [Paenibacillus sp. UNC496MF]|uniref:hypothetical protein n=1 Tax=Paenibacillus sp. UNC496MF TaxID=1502753 RepID=UPI001160A767|nr:hypothetical protein [Paenibacillus sp. UNC496MF]